MNKKEFYASPEAELFEVRFEGVVCQSTGEQVKDQEPWSVSNGWS